MLTHNTVFLFAIVLYVVTKSFGAKLSCLPGSSCSKQKRSANCPPCIPFNEEEHFKYTCPDRPFCVKTKRSTDSKEECPPCIPIYQVEYYQPICPSTSICTREKRSSNCGSGCIPFKGKCKCFKTKRSANCPPCIPFNEKEYYKSTARCLDRSICAAKTKRSTSSKEECPPCIPIYQVEYYQSICPSTSICTREKRSTNCGSGCIPFGGKCKCSKSKRSANCPACIPLKEAARYQDCPGISICSSRKRRGPCPPCIPEHEAHRYSNCSDTRLCVEAKGKKSE